MHFAIAFYFICSMLQHDINIYSTKKERFILYFQHIKLRVQRHSNYARSNAFSCKSYIVLTYKKYNIYTYVQTDIPDWVMYTFV